MNALFPTVSVDGVVIAQESIAEEAQNHPVEGHKPGLVWRRAAQALVIRELLIKEANRRELKPIVEAKGSGVEEENEALIRALVEEEIDETIFDELAVAREYAKSKHALKSPSIYGISHILFALEDQGKTAEVETRANAVLNQLLAEPSRFGALAASQSECSSSKNEGYLGQMTEVDFVPEMRPILEELERGTVHPKLVKTRFGFHILRLDQKGDGQELPEDFAKNMLRENMEKYAWVVSGQRLVQRLYAEAEIQGVNLSVSEEYEGGD